MSLVVDQRARAAPHGDPSRGLAHGGSIDDVYVGRCRRCGSPRWISVSLNGGWTRVPQCVPCGAIHPVTLGKGLAQR